MKKLTKSLLNYYAAFNETRFRFTTKINYAWTDDYQTLDFSLFPEFSKQMIEKINLQQEIEFDIKNNDYALFLDQEDFKKSTIEKITEGYGDDYLKNCINQAKEKLSEKTIIVDNEVVKIDTSTPENIQKYTEEGVKTYAASIRKLVRNTLTELQIKKRLLFAGFRLDKYDNLLLGKIYELIHLWELSIVQLNRKLINDGEYSKEREKLLGLIKEVRKKVDVLLK